MALYKRKTYLINKSFQLKFSLYLCLIVIVSSIIYPITIYELYESVSQSLSSQFPHAAKEFVKQKSSILQVLTIWQVSFTILIFIVGIFISHKVAGPIFKLQKFIRTIKESNNHDKLVFRNGDHFNEVATEYNKTITYLNTKNENIRDGLNNIKSLITEIENKDLAKKIEDNVDRLRKEVE